MVRPATYLTASATCTSVDHPHPRTSCSPGTDGSIGCLLRWTVHRETLYAAPQEIDLNDELRKAATVSFKDTGGNDRQSLFFLCADGKAQVLMAGCQNWKAETPWCHRVLGLHA